MAYKFTQPGAEIQDILDQVGTNTGNIAQNTNDIGTINTALTPAVTAWTKASTSQIGSSTGGNFYQIGKICLFFGTIYISNASANVTYTAVNNAPAPAEAWGFSGQGGHASGATASYVLIINGNTMSIRPKVAISSEQGLYVSGAYVTA